MREIEKYMWERWEIQDPQLDGLYSWLDKKSRRTNARYEIPVDRIVEGINTYRKRWRNRVDRWLKTCGQRQH
jgi:hypothetical protein